MFVTVISIPPFKVRDVAKQFVSTKVDSYGPCLIKWGREVGTVGRRKTAELALWEHEVDEHSTKCCSFQTPENTLSSSNRSNPSQNVRLGSPVSISYHASCPQLLWSAIHAEALCARDCQTGWLHYASIRCCLSSSEQRASRYLENLYQRTNDNGNAGTFLSTPTNIDAETIGALGICASGGYVSFAAQTNKRIKVVATVSAVDLGVLNAEAFNGFGGAMLPTSNGQVAEAGRQRTAEALRAPPNKTRIVPHTPPMSDPICRSSTKRLTSIIKPPGGRAETSPDLNLWRSIDMLTTYRSFTFIHLISPRPLRMVASKDDDILYFSERAMELA